MVGCLIGFGVGWLAFDWPFGHGGISRHDVEVQVLKAGHYRNAVCGRREYPTNVWDCSVTLGGIGVGGNVVATVEGDGHIRVGRLTVQ